MPAGRNRAGRAEHEAALGVHLERGELGDELAQLRSSQEAEMQAAQEQFAAERAEAAVRGRFAAVRRPAGASRQHAWT